MPGGEFQRNLKLGIDVVMTPQSHKVINDFAKVLGMIGGGTSGRTSASGGRGGAAGQFFRDVSKEAKKAADDQEKEAKRISRIMQSRDMWMYKERVRLAREAAKEQLKLEREAAKEQQRLAREAVKAAKDAARLQKALKKDWVGRQAKNLESMAGRFDPGSSMGRSLQSASGFFAQFSGNLTGANSRLARFIYGIRDGAKGVQKLWMGLKWVASQARSVFLAFTVVAYGVNMITMPIDILLQKVGRFATMGVKAILGVGKAAITAAGEMEYMRFRMDAVFGAKGQANWEWLMDFTIGMPFTINELGDAFNMLGVYGVDSLTNIQRAMQDVTDTAVALNRVPTDVALGIALGAKGAPGGMRRLRQMGITPAEVVAAGGVPSEKGGQGLDPNFASRNADAILKVMEKKFSGIGARMANTWKQIMDDMRDMWYRFSYALTQTPAFKQLASIMGGIRTRFVEMMKSGDLQKYAVIFSSAFMALKPVAMYIVERLPGAVELAAKWLTTGATNFGKFLSKQSIGEYMQSWLTFAQTQISVVEQILNFYIDLKMISYQVRVELALIAAQLIMFHTRVVQRKGPGTQQFKDAQANLEAAKTARDWFSSKGEGSIRGKLKGTVSTVMETIRKGLEDLKGLTADKGMKGAIDNFASAADNAGRKVQQVAEDMDGAADEMEKVSDKVESFLRGASTLQSLRYLFLTKSGFTPKQAVKLLNLEQKRDQLYGRTYGTGIATGDIYPPGEKGWGGIDDDSSELSGASDGMNRAADKQQAAASTMQDAAIKITGVSWVNRSADMQQAGASTKQQAAASTMQQDAIKIAGAGGGAGGGVYTPAAPMPIGFSGTFNADDPASGTARRWFGGRGAADRGISSQKGSKPGGHSKFGDTLLGRITPYILGLGTAGFGTIWAGKRILSGKPIIPRFKPRVRGYGSGGGAAAGVPEVPGFGGSASTVGGVSTAAGEAAEAAAKFSGWTHGGMPPYDPTNIGKGAMATRGGSSGAPSTRGWLSKIFRGKWFGGGAAFLPDFDMQLDMFNQVMGTTGSERRGNFGPDWMRKMDNYGFSGSGSVSGGVVVNQVFNGPADPAQVKQATQDGIRAAQAGQLRRQARSAGY